MPSVSQRQNRFMHAVAEGDVKGVPKSVGRDFVRADEGRQISKLPQTAPKKPKRGDDFMAKRKGAGQSYRSVAKEFGVGKSTAHRRVTGHAMRNGFHRLGDA